MEDITEEEVLEAAISLIRMGLIDLVEVDEVNQVKRIVDTSDLSDKEILDLYESDSYAILRLLA